VYVVKTVNINLKIIDANEIHPDVKGIFPIYIIIFVSSSGLKIPMKIINGLKIKVRLSIYTGDILDNVTRITG
jgi:hypothetical protein